MQGTNSAAVLAAIKQLQQSEQVSMSWPIKELGRHLWMVMKDRSGCLTGFVSFPASLCRQLQSSDPNPEGVVVLSIHSHVPVKV